MPHWKACRRGCCGLSRYSRRHAMTHARFSAGSGANRPVIQKTPIGATRWWLMDQALSTDSSPEARWLAFQPHPGGI